MEVEGKKAFEKAGFVIEKLNSLPLQCKVVQKSSQNNQSMFDHLLRLFRVN